jgi:hypothetical protein
MKDRKYFENYMRLPRNNMLRKIACCAFALMLLFLAGGLPALPPRARSSRSCMSAFSD